MQAVPLALGSIDCDQNPFGSIGRFRVAAQCGCLLMTTSLTKIVNAALPSVIKLYMMLFHQSLAFDNHTLEESQVFFEKSVPFLLFCVPFNS